MCHGADLLIISVVCSTVCVYIRYVSLQIFDGKERTYKGVLDCGRIIRRPSAIYLAADDTLIAVNYIDHSVNVYKLVV